MRDKPLQTNWYSCTVYALGYRLVTSVTDALCEKMFAVQPCLSGCTCREYPTPLLLKNILKRQALTQEFLGSFIPACTSVFRKTSTTSVFFFLSPHWVKSQSSEINLHTTWEGVQCSFIHLPKIKTPLLKSTGRNILWKKYKRTFIAVL